MPAFEVTGPDGKSYEVNTPEGSTERDAIRYVQNQYYSAPEPVAENIPFTPTPETGLSSFVPAVKRGALGIKSLVGDVIPAMAGRVGEKLGVQGAGKYADRQMAEAAAEQQRIQQMYPSAVPSYTDIKSGGDLLTYVVESVGELVPSMIPSILTGGAAGIAGRGAAVAAEQAAKKAATEAAKRELMKDSVQAAVKSGAYGGQQETLNALKTVALEAGVKAGREAASKVALKYQAAGAIAGSALQNVPEVYQNVAQETGQEDLGAALLFGGFNSVLDAITPLSLLRKAKGIGLTEKELIGAWYKRAGKGVLTGFATEGATESIQEMSSAAAEKFVDNNKEFFTPQNFERFINAGPKGGIGGGVASGAANVAFGKKERAVPSVTPEQPPTTQEGTEPPVPPTPTANKSTEEAVAQAMAAGKPKEETADVTKPTFTQAGGASAEVLSEPGGAVPTEGATTSGPAGVADIASATSLIEGGEGAEQRPLNKATKPEEAAPPVAEEEKPDILEWARSKGYSPTDGTLDWPALKEQWEAETGQTTPKPEEVITEEGIGAEVKPAAVEPIIEEVPVAKAEAFVETKEEELNRLAKAPRSINGDNKRQQAVRQQQTQTKAKVDKDKTIPKENKDGVVAAQNYLLGANNNMDTALDYLAFDMASKSQVGDMAPGTGGKYATSFYNTLNDTQKATVDLLVDKHNKTLNKYKIADKQRSKTEKKKADTKEQAENYNTVEDDAYMRTESKGYATPKFVGRVLRGDMRGALEEIVSGSGYSALDKAIANRLLKIGSFPAIQVVNEERLQAQGKYDAATDVAYIGENNINSHTLLHEATHGFTLAMIKAHVDGLIKNPAVQNLIDLYEQLKSNPDLVGKYGMKDVAEFIAEAWSNPEFQAALSNIPYKRSNAFTEFTRMVLRILGITPSNEFTALAYTLLESNRLFDQGRELQVTNPPPATANLEGKAQKEPKAPELRDIDSADSWIKGMPSQPDTKTKTVKDRLTDVPAAKKIVTLLQNERFPIKNWEDLLAQANKIVYSGDNTTAIYNEITLATGRAEDEFLAKMYQPSKEVYKLIGEYTKARGVDDKTALNELQAIFIAMHEPERRRMKYLMTVPLTADAAAQRKEIINLVRSSEIDEDTARVLRTMLDDLVANNKPPVDGLGYVYEEDLAVERKATGQILDESSDFYNVAGIRPDIVKDTINKYYAPYAEIIKPLRDAVQEVHKATIELDKKANYWSQPVSNTVAFYGYENYVPLKGRPDKKESKIDELLNFDSTSNGRELQDAAFATEGRISESDNPLLQSLADGVRAALRAGRGGTMVNPDGTTEQYGITLAVKNAINQELLSGELVETIAFKDRNKAEFSQKLKEKGETTFYHYMPDGSIEIYSIGEKRLREAIRRTYRTTQPLIDAANNITSVIGQFHTRYNVAFAPMNFIRDTLTNAFTMGAEMGPGKVAAIAGKVMQGGLTKSFKVSRLYEAGKFEEIEKLAKTDAYIADMYEYIRLGGKVSYISGIGAESQYQKLQQNLGASKVVTTKAQIDGVIDIWSDTFELASRVAAYQVAKAEYINGPLKLSEREAAAKATGYVKNLANFEQVGAWGKQLGALFMFFRPSATGAVRAIEALAPLFRNVDDSIANLPESVRNDPAAVETFRANMERQRAAAQRMLAALAGAGATIYLMALMMAEDDDEGRNKVSTDDMARWTRFARFPIPGTDIIVQIPWGFGLGAFAAMAAQVLSFGIGNNSFKDTLTNVKDIGLDSFLPLPASKINVWENPAAWAMDSATPSAFRPFLEYAMNLDGLGREIYNNRQSRTGDAYSGGDNIPELYKDAAKMLANITNGAVDFSPNTMFFFANNYADGLSRLVHNTYNIGLFTAGQKDFNPKTDTMVFDSFFGAPSNFDARQFSKVENQIKDKERKLNMFKNDPERYMEYVSANPYDQGIVDMYNKGINGDLKEARTLANKYRSMPGLTAKERKDLLVNIKEQQNLIKRHLISVFEAYDILP